MRAALLSLPLLLAACGGPRLSAEAIANGHTVLVTNGEDHDVTIQRIVANGEEDKAECVDSPGHALGAGRTYTVTFFYCDTVTRVAVDTDAGTARLSVATE